MSIEITNLGNQAFLYRSLTEGQTNKILKEEMLIVSRNHHQIFTEI